MKRGKIISLALAGLISCGIMTGCGESPDEITSGAQDALTDYLIKNDKDVQKERGSLMAQNYVSYSNGQENGQKISTVSTDPVITGGSSKYDEDNDTVIFDNYRCRIGSLDFKFDAKVKYKGGGTESYNYDVIEYEPEKSGD